MKKISVGIDIGSVASKAAAYDGQEIIALAMRPTGWSPREVGQELLDEILEKTGLEREQIHAIVGTGYGRVSLPFVDKRITEISCHGRGAFYLDKSIRTVIDIGGQDSKIIKINEKGQVLDFLMNDKCAAGTGRFLQVMANALEVDVSELSNLARGSQAAKISSMCTVFAESEVVSLIGEGTDKSSIAHGLLNSVAEKIYALAGRLGVEGQVYFSGGVSKSELLREILEEKLNKEILHSQDSQYVGAIGGAVLGYK